MQCNITQIFTKNEMKSMRNVMERCQNISSKLKAKDGKKMWVYTLYYYCTVHCYRLLL